MAFLLLLVLSATGQAHHDSIERQISTHLERQHDTILDLWPQASHRLLSDFIKARACYVRFHLQKVITCDDALSAVDQDLAKELDAADAASRLDPYSRSSDVVGPSLDAQR
jgi:hypothetical protein